jgi:hypothetical protein
MYLPNGAMTRIDTACFNDEGIENSFYILHQAVDCIFFENDFVAFLEMSHDLKLRGSVLLNSSAAMDDIVTQTAQIAEPEHLERTRIL